MIPSSGVVCFTIGAGVTVSGGGLSMAIDAPRTEPGESFPAADGLGILVVVADLNPEAPGGVSRVVEILAREWNAQGQRVTVFQAAPWSQSHLQRQLEGGVVRYRKRLRLPWDRRRPVRGLLGWLAEFPVTLWEIRRIIRRERVDIIHLHALQFYQYAFLGLRRVGGPPCVVTLHGTDILRLKDRSGWEQRLLRRVMTSADQVTAVAPSLVEAARRLGNMPPVRLIANGVPVAEVAAAGRAGVTVPHPLPERYLVVVGHVEPVKGVEVALHALASLQAEWPELGLVVVGGIDFAPDYVAELWRLAEELGIGGRVVYTGQVTREEAWALMARALAVLIPSRREGLPNVVLEAGALAKPVVAAAIPPFTELMGHELTALLVPVGSDPGEEGRRWAAALHPLLADGAAATAMGQAWQQQVVQSYTSRQMAAHYLALFRGCLRNQGPQSV